MFLETLFDNPPIGEIFLRKVEDFRKNQFYASGKRRYYSESIEGVEELLRVASDITLDHLPFKFIVRDRWTAQRAGFQ